MNVTNTLYSMQLFNELKDHQFVPSDILWTLASEIF